MHQESLCGKAFRMEHEVGTITQAVKFIYSQSFKSPSVQDVSGGIKLRAWWLALSHKGARAQSGKGTETIFWAAWDLPIHGSVVGDGGAIPAVKVLFFWKSGQNTWISGKKSWKSRQKWRSAFAEKHMNGTAALVLTLTSLVASNHLGHKITVWSANEAS